MTAVRRALHFVNPLATARGSWGTAAKGRSRRTLGGVLSISTFVAFFLSTLSAEAIEIIFIPTVEITALSHSYSGDGLTFTDASDGAYFPCVSTCSSSGFSAAIVNGDEILMRFEAPVGQQFHVFLDPYPEYQDTFTVSVKWQAFADSITVTSAAIVNFENLRGTAPTQSYNLFGVGNNGGAVGGEWDGTVTGDFTFTALTLRFTVNNSPPAEIAIFGPVSGNGFSADGLAFLANASDLTQMQLEPLPDTDEDGIPDLTDNCPFTPNGPLLGTCLGNFPQGQALCHANSDCTSGMCSLNQEDTGGVGVGSPPDGIGDACQCGDVNNDGIVTDIDATLIKRSFVNLPPYPSGVTTLPGYHKCQVVNGAPGLTCNNTQASLIQRAVVGLPPGIKQGCQAATIFP